MGFQQGLSGLAAAAKAIDVVSNNIANSSTVGFKSSTAQFSDVYAASLVGAAATGQTGIGSRVAAVRQSFTSGGGTTTNNPLDMAINGGGFFYLETGAVGAADQQQALSRNGQFVRDANGYIVNAQGHRLLGYQTQGAGGGVAAPATPNGQFVPLRLPFDTVQGQATSEIGVDLNLDAGAVRPAGLDYDFTTSIPVFDSLGFEHSLELYFVKDGAASNSWTVFSAADGAAVDFNHVPPGTLSDNFLGSVSFNTDGTLASSTLTTPFAPPAVPPAVTPGDFGNGSAIFEVDIDLSQITQFRYESTVRDFSQNGFESGSLVSFSIGKDGLIEGLYTNGERRRVGWVGLVDVNNPNGLVSLGDNLWQATRESGVVVPGSPGDGRFGAVTAGAVEDSNVDLTQELVQLIIMQRNYQANAQSIRTQDQLLQTVTNLR